MIIAACDHTKGVTLESNATHLVDHAGTRYMLDLKATCAGCGKPFRFVGLPLGVSVARATMLPSGLEASLPMELDA